MDGKLWKLYFVKTQTAKPERENLDGVNEKFVDFFFCFHFVFPLRRRHSSNDDNFDTFGASVKVKKENCEKLPDEKTRK